MVVDVTKESFNVSQLVEKKSKTITVQEDFIVPDIKPDILNIISTTGNVFISKKEMLNGKVKLEGCINLYIIYLAANGENRSINSVMNFNDFLELGDASDNLTLEDNVNIRNIDVQILNERKISITGNVNVEVKTYDDIKIDIVNGLKDVNNVQKLEKNLEIKALIGRANTKANSKENVEIDKIDDLAEIFKVDLRVENIENKISYNKVLAKADLELKIMYFTEDNRVGCAKKTLPIMGFLDINGISDTNICNTKFNIKNVLVKPNSKEEHSIYVEVDFEISCKVYENKKINIIEDLYGTKQNIKFTCNPIMIENSDLKDNEEIHELREKISIPEATSIIDATATVNLLNQKKYGDNLEIEGEIQVNILYETESSPLNIRNVNFPFTHKFENVKDNIELELYIKDENYMRNTDETININVDVGIIKNSSSSNCLNIIENIEVEDMADEKLYSLIIYFVKQGDTLWKIAKEFKSTVDDIVKINSIENKDKLEIGEKLFIPQNV